VVQLGKNPLNQGDLLHQCILTAAHRGSHLISDQDLASAGYHRAEF